MRIGLEFGLKTGLALLFPQVLEKNGGDDETRTRDLCRDRVAVCWNLVILNGADSPSLEL
jgi:hypothetical protein